MRPPWVLLLLLALVLSPCARADPAVLYQGPDAAIAEWSFSNPANYTLENVTLDFAGASLSLRTRTETDTDPADFARAVTLGNIDLAGSPGDAAILNTSGRGPPTTLPYQPPPGDVGDTYLYAGGGANTNFGTSPDLRVGYWGNPEWNRILLQVPAFPIPGNATVLETRLELYLHTADTPDPMSLSVHRATTSWTELGASWNDYDGSNPWNASGGGGDFDPATVDVVSGVTTDLGWYSWNVTSLVQGWRSGTVSNQGLLLRQADDDLGLPIGRKQFYSSDAPNTSLRPRFLILYATPASTGILESHVLDGGGTTSWGAIRWNGTLPAGTSISIQTRSGDVPAPDGSWSPWTPPYAFPGSAIGSPASRYLQYRATLFTANAATPLLHDVSASFARFAGLGTAETEPFLPAGLTGWGRLDVTQAGAPGTNVTVFVSQDGGVSWVSVLPGGDLGAIPGTITLRVALSTNDTTRTPVVRSVSLGFTVAAAPGAIPGLLWSLALLPLALVGAWWIARRLLREPFRPSELFLIHTDGRLLLRVGGKETAMRDEMAVSGMFTLVARFVKDSFGGTPDGKGELKSFQVDEREVTIAKGGHLFLALVARGPAPPALGSTMNEFLRVIERDRPELREWDGLREGVGDLEGPMRWFLDGGHRRERGGPAERMRGGGSPP